MGGKERLLEGSDLAFEFSRIELVKFVGKLELDVLGNVRMSQKTLIGGLGLIVRFSDLTANPGF